MQSAGSAPSRVNPYALAVLHELGVDTTGLHAKHVDTIDPSTIDLVITLCAEESCPLFLGDAARWSWSMPDPDRAHEAPSDEERLASFRHARDAIAARLTELDALAR